VNNPAQGSSADQTAPTHRVERDLIGERNVPADVYWGIHTLRALENYRISGRTINDYPVMIKAIASVKKAAASANRDLGVLAQNKAVAIISACDQIISAGAMRDQFPIDVYQGGAGTSVNMNANEVIANLALEILGHPKGAYDVINPNDDINMSQSTNDAYPTAFRLAIYRYVNQMERHLGQLQDAFEAKAREFGMTLKMGRTQLQDAVPMTAGAEFHAFATLISEERHWLLGLAEHLLEINLGATAIGTGINTPKGYAPLAIGYLSQITGLPFVMAENLVEATSDTGAYVSVHAGLKRIAIKLSKICNDLRLLSSGPRAGLGELKLPEMAAGSSIMPAKVNPIIPEVVNQIAFKVIGNDLVVTLASEAGQLQLNAMEPVIAQALFESTKLLRNGSDTLRTHCIDGITLNANVTEAHVRNSIGLVTYLSPIVGHAEADRIGQIALATGKSVPEVVLDEGLLDVATVNQLFSAENLLSGRAELHR